MAGSQIVDAAVQAERPPAGEHRLHWLTLQQTGELGANVGFHQGVQRMTRALRVGAGAGTGTGSGSGTKGQQAGGAVAPGHKPTTKTTVSTKTETKDNKSDKKDSDKSDKKDEKKSDKKDSKSDKKSDSKSDTGAASTTTAKKSSSASEQETGTNPLAIVGVAAGVIGLALIAVFVLTKRGKGDGNAR